MYVGKVFLFIAECYFMVWICNAFRVDCFLFGFLHCYGDGPSYGSLCLYSARDFLGFLNMGVTVAIQFGENIIQYLLKKIFSVLFSLSSFGTPSAQKLDCLILFHQLLMLGSFFSIFFSLCFSFVQSTDKLLISDIVFFIWDFHYFW